FIPADVKDEVFQALCTIAGGEKIDDLDDLCPVVPPERTELKTQPLPEAKPPEVKPPDVKPPEGGARDEKPQGNALAAAAFTKEFADDPKAADKYTRKKVVVEGVVADVDIAQDVVRLKGHEPGSEVICFFKDGKGVAKTVKPDQVVRIEGECQGRILGS